MRLRIHLKKDGIPAGLELEGLVDGFGTGDLCLNKYQDKHGGTADHESNASILHCWFPLLFKVLILTAEIAENAEKSFYNPLW